MGTRADFYSLENNKFIWHGSIAWDGYDIDDVGKTKSLTAYKARLSRFLKDRDDSTYPDDGFPWPWKNSKLTDEVYVFIPSFLGGKVWRKFDFIGDHNDHTKPIIFVPIDKYPEYDEKRDEYAKPKKKLELCVPDVSGIQNVSFGRNSGIILISTK